MIAPLRRRHYRIWIVLACLLPLLLAASLYLRKAPPRINPWSFQQ